MSSLRSSSSSRAKFEFSSDNGESPLTGRRPSWTPSLPGRVEHEDSGSHSKRRSRQHDDKPFVLPEWQGTVPNLLKARRPSLAPSIPEVFSRARKPRMEMEESPEVVKLASDVKVQPESPEEGKGFRSSWEINVKDLVGDAVGNMSISPASRDIVLAARRGLFIIDLESPFSIPRFLPQGGTWDVADVQWNPHHSHAQYIVSTSSEKLLIWNLRLGGKTSIEHILLSHYRAITDINWHTTECDIVVSTGIDSWLWAWDLRTPRKPIFGLSAFKSGGTQVKWNRKDGNLLASSHSNEVLIWDRRKGSLPVTQIRAHASKIYGIDWSRSSRNEIVTCSLDKTIKTWDIMSTNPQGNSEPKSTIRTTYPVWRARNLPFGEGVLSLPQRGDTTLEMYAKSDSHNPVETFEGHSDVVKEFVWRKGNQDDSFQLITWSKDRTLRFWPIDAEVMHKVGHVPEIIRGRTKLTRNEMESMETFRNPPEGKESYPAFSAPIGNRGILAEVRAPHPPKAFPTPHPGYGFPAFPPLDNENLEATPTIASSRPIVVTAKSTGGTMSKGGTGAKSVAQVDQLAWLANVKVGGKRGSSSGGASQPGSGAQSRLQSQSRPPSGPDWSVGETEGRQRSGSLSRVLDESSRKEGEGNQSLHDEITSVLTKLAASKIKLEKHDLTKKRTCTLGLHGPWGETSSVFMRVTFTFPREYPQAIAPQGAPTVELERNPLISMSDRAFILKHLRRIRERKRPCLEACLRFLLFADEGRNDRELVDSGSSSDDDDEPTGKKSRDVTVSLLRNNKNLAEPRTSQGAFGPNGELICFFRAPPRIVKNVLRGLTDPSSKGAEEPHQAQSPDQQPEPQPPPPPPQKTSYFQSPALVSDAVRRLGLAAMDRIVRPIDPKQPEVGSNLIRAMTNLLTVPQRRARRDSDSKQADEVAKNYALLSARRSTVFLTSTINIAGADMKVGMHYVFVPGREGSLADVCQRNAVTAKERGRFDHERVFRTLGALFRQEGQEEEGDAKGAGGSAFSSDLLAAQVIKRLYSDLAKEKDIQMLAMISMLVLQTEHAIIALPPTISRKKDPTPVTAIPLRLGGVDYFSLRKGQNLTSPLPSPAWPRLPSPGAPPLQAAASLSSSNSSRGSWSSLFNTGSVRQFMNGVQDSLKEGLATPNEIFISAPSSKSAERLNRGGLDSPGPRRRRARLDSNMHSPTVESKSWNEGILRHPSKTLSASFSSAGHRRPLLRFVDTNSYIHEKHVVIFEAPIYEESNEPLFDPQLVQQFRLNVYVYAEILFRWQLFHKRLELLKAVNQQEASLVKMEPHRIGLLRLCARSDCRMVLPDKSNICQYCGSSSSKASCTICRLPVKGLSRTCLSCSHVTHISCWNSLDVTVPICPSGCGCFCTGSDGPFTRPSTRLGLTPPFPSMLNLPSEIS
ncbi:hypothetical protein B0H34DRAFT_685839 [Crassisporium funariophilum]|nr:hypothetical protein B0H34DRAFT_685839 [Crassisporium funariophilum]